MHFTSMSIHHANGMKLLVCSAAIILLACFGSSQAQAQLEKMRIAYSAIAGSQASFWIPYEAGIFRKHGLDVELLYVGGGGRAAQVVQSGEVPVGIFTGGAVVNANLAGGDLVIIAGALNVFTFVVMTKPEIRRVEDLRGKKIGISRFGSATDFGLRFAEAQWPLKRQKDFAVIQVGGVTDILTAMKSGAVDAGVINAELAILARRDGFTAVADISKMGLSFPTSSVVTTRSYIKRSENTLRKFVRGYVEGVHYAKTQRAFSVQIMSKYMRNNDPALLNELYELYLIQNMQRIPAPTPEPIKTVLAQLAETDSRAAALRPEQFIDARFFQEMEKDGFAQKLWKQ
jgi:NitT/TauT family transport system substrate-binding protein